MEFAKISLLVILALDYVAICMHCATHFLNEFHYVDDHIIGYAAVYKHNLVDKVQGELHLLQKAVCDILCLELPARAEKNFKFTPVASGISFMVPSGYYWRTNESVIFSYGNSEYPMITRTKSIAIAGNPVTGDRTFRFPLPFVVERDLILPETDFSRSICTTT